MSVVMGFRVVIVQVCCPFSLNLWMVLTLFSCVIVHLILLCHLCC